MNAARLLSRVIMFGGKQKPYNNSVSERRIRREIRQVLLGLAFMASFLVIAGKMAVVALSTPEEPRSSPSVSKAISQRADIVDRNGLVIATNMPTNSLYAHPHLLAKGGGARRAAENLAAIFPEIDAERLHKDLTGKRKFIWIKRRISPEQMQLVHNIGEPELLFGSRETRIYPNGELAAHILGGTIFENEGVHSADVIGFAGVEKTFDSFLRDPANNGAPLVLSIDLTLQFIATKLLSDGVKLFGAKGGSAVLLDVHNGQVLALVSIPGFDPNHNRKRFAKGANAEDSPDFNRAVQGVYEFGSVFKVFAVAQALDIGFVSPESVIATTPIRIGKFVIKDHYGPRDSMTVRDVLVRSSNAGAVRLALQSGANRQREFLENLGLGRILDLEVAESAVAKPKMPKRWSNAAQATVAFGYGLSATPVHLAAAFAAIVNGGYYFPPTILAHSDGNRSARQVISGKTSAQMRDLLSQVVESGTGRAARIDGYSIGGKTGTADKANPRGGYYRDRVLSTFASFFPASDPRYVLVVSLDEPSAGTGTRTERTAGQTAAPLAGEMITRLAPALGLWPEDEEPEVQAQLASGI